MGRVAAITLLGAALAMGACGSRSAPGSEDGGSAADMQRPDALALPDIPAQRDALALPDAAPKADLGPPCTCSDPQDVVLIGACVPTKQLFECGPTCAIMASNPCPSPQGNKMVCDTTAGTPSCMSSTVVPACVPGMGMALPPGTLRISPTEGNAGDDAKLTIRGGSLYIGALWWVIRMGKQQPVPLKEVSTTKCTYPTTLRPPGPGIHPVEIAYGGGGGGGGGNGWTLAGFYVANSGAASPKLAQPGERCAASLPCAEAAPYTCGCVSGRCACKK